MLNRKIMIMAIFLVGLLAVSTVNAADDLNSSSDDNILEISNSNDEIQTDDVLQEPSSHTINASNYNSYFNINSGELVSADVKDGDTIYLDGTLDGTNLKNGLVFNKKVNVVGTESNSMKNVALKFTNGASGSNISNLKIFNTIKETYGIFLNGASDCVIKDCFIRNTGQSSYAVCVANGANYNNVTNNILQTYGISYGQGTRSSPTIVLCDAHYNCIANNSISCDDANAIYFSSYSGGPLNGGVSNFNTIFNNTVKYNVLATSWGYGIQIMGGNNIIDSNTVIGGYRAISTSSGTGNIIINNRLINLTGADYSNPGVEVGGEYAIVGSANSRVINNSIVGARVISSGSAISVLDKSIVENNSVETIYLGVGITASGSNIIIKNNNISTVSGSGIFWKGKVRNLTIVGNTITSQRGTGVLIKNDGSKKMPGDLTITDNYVATNATYAIDAREVNASSIYIIDNNIVPKGKGLIGTPAGSYDPTKPKYNFNGTTYTITPSNYNDYINANGNLESSIKDGDILVFDGNFSNKGIIYVSSAVKITGNNPIFYNTTFRLSSDGVWIENITIKNRDAERLNAWGVLAYKIASATITNCDIEVVDPNAAYAIYVVESSGVDVLNNRLSSSGNYLTYTLLAISAEDCNFINNTIFTLGTGIVHNFENEHCIDGNETCTDGSSCVDGDSCVDGNTCVDGDACVDGNTCVDGDSCVDGNTCVDGNSCVDGNTVCTSGDTISGNHVLKEVYRTYGILMVYSSNCNVSDNKVNVTSKLNQTYTSPDGESTYLHNSIPTNSIVGIDIYYNSHNNTVSNNDVYVKANDNYIYGVGVLGIFTGHDAPEGEGATNNQFINNNIVLMGPYFVQGIVIGDESENTKIIGNTVYAQSYNYSYGINLEMSRKSIVKQNNFTLKSDLSYGIEAFQSEGNLINGNGLIIEAKQAYAVVLSNSSGNELKSNKFLNNVTGENITYKISDAVGVGVAGAYLQGNSNYNIIEDNNITTTKGYAIVLGNQSHDNYILGNCLSSENGVAGEAIDNLANNTAEGNYIQVLNGNMSDVEVNYLETATIVANVDVDGVLVRFYLCDDEIGNATVSDGKAVLTYKIDETLTPADYALSAVTFSNNCSTLHLSSVLTVNKGNLNVVFEEANSYISGNTTLVALVRDASGNAVSGISVKFYLNSKRYVYLGEAKSDENGLAIIVTSTPPLELGSYEILANATGDDNFNSASANSTMEIKQMEQNTPSDANDVDVKVVYKITGSRSYSAYYGNTINYKVRLLGSNGEFAGAGVAVTIKVGSSVYNVVTDGNGYAEKSLKLKAGAYSVTATCDGDSVSGIVTFKPTLIAKNISKKKSKVTKFKVKLVNKNGKILKNKKIKFKIKNKKYTAKTNKKGIATLSIKNLKVGKYTITSSYGGCTISNKIIIKKIKV